MFFKIKPTSDSNFTEQTKITDRYWLNIDSGWNIADVSGSVVYYKGYVDEFAFTQDLLKSIVNDPTPRYPGNFLVIIIRGQEITISHDLHRGSPVTITDECCHNFPELGRNILASEYIRFTDLNKIESISFDAIGPIDSTPLTRNDALNQIDEIMHNRLRKFYTHNRLPVRVFLTGGVDTLIIYSYIKSMGLEHELCTCEHLDYTEFVCKNIATLKKNWGYRQIHNWTEPSVLVTGVCGDNIMLRNAPTTNLIMMHWGSSLLDCPTDQYHYPFLQKADVRSLYIDQLQNLKTKQLSTRWDLIVKNMLNVNLNDHQHWHLDNTLTFTPLKDLEITKIMLRMPQEDIVAQIFDGMISKELIRRNFPDLLQFVNRYKNVSNQTTLWSLYQQYL
jgi:hypothetical protein